MSSVHFDLTLNSNAKATKNYQLFEIILAKKATSWGSQTKIVRKAIALAWALFTGSSTFSCTTPWMWMGVCKSKIHSGEVKMISFSFTHKKIEIACSSRLRLHIRKLWWKTNRLIRWYCMQSCRFVRNFMCWNVSAFDFSTGCEHAKHQVWIKVTIAPLWSAWQRNRRQRRTETEKCKKKLEYPYASKSTSFIWFSPKTWNKR